MSLKERLDNSGSRRGPSDSVFLQGGAQFFVLDKLARRLHGTQQRSLGVELRRRGPFLGERRHVVATLALDKRRQCALLGIIG